jgi:hypothetical protein
MSTHVTIEDGHGERLANLADTNDVLGALRDRFTGPLSGLDPYGRSMFNRIQTPLVLEEAEKLAKAPEVTEDQLAFLSSLIELARRAAGEPHLYLWFYGD